MTPNIFPIGNNKISSKPLICGSRSMPTSFQATYSQKSMRKFHQSCATRRSASRSSAIDTSDGSRINEAPAAQPSATTENSSQFTCSATKKDKPLLKFASRSPESIATFAENRFKISSCIDYLPKTVTFTMFFNALRHVLPNSLKLSRSSPQLLTMLVRFLRFFPANVLPV